MVPNAAKRGTSFKGVGQYLLHDKRSEFQAEQKIAVDSTERVDWTQTRNLATNDPDMAIKVMAATAMDKDRLKEEAGVRRSGNKSKGDVYHYSLSWHPDEAGKIDKAEMLKAADQSLKAIGGQDHQALIIAHVDEPQPHIHVVVNMVNPANGKNLNLSNDRRKFDKWAHDYRKERGEEKLYCKDRTQKHQAIEDRKQGKEVDYVRPKRSRPKRQRKEKNQSKNIAPEALKKWQGQQAAKTKSLSDVGRALNDRQAKQWEGMNDKYTAKKKDISKQYFNEKDRAIEAIKAQMKPEYKKLYRRHFNERDTFNKNEKSLYGKAVNAAEAAGYGAVQRGKLDIAADSKNRAGWTSARQQNEVKALRLEENKRIKGATKSLNKTRLKRLNIARQDYQLERSGLVAKHHAENDHLKKKWQVRHDERETSLNDLQMRHGIGQMNRDTRSVKHENQSRGNKRPKGQFEEQTKGGFNVPVKRHPLSQEELRRSDERVRGFDRYDPNDTGGQEFKEAAGRKSAGAEYRNKLKRAGASERRRKPRGYSR